MQYTTHYNLLKPQPTDLVDVANLNTNSDTLDTLIYNSAGFYGDIESWYKQNVIPIMNGSETWTAGTVTPTNDTTNVKIGGQSIRLTEPDDVASDLTASLTSISLDLSKFSDGSSSATSDYVRFVCYISDITYVNQIYLSLKTDGSNYYYKVINSGIGNYWNYIDIKKSDFGENGSPNWNNITIVNIEWTSIINGAGTYVSFQYLGVIRKDPSELESNPFQRKINNAYVADFNITKAVGSGGCWYLGLEDGRITMKCLNSTGTGTGTTAAVLTGTQSFTNNFTIRNIQVQGTTIQIMMPVFEIDANNRFGVDADANYIYLYTTVSGVNDYTTYIYMGLAAGDTLDITFSKNSTTISMIAYKNNDYTKPYKLTKEVSFTSAGYLSIGSSGDSINIIRNLSITTSPVSTDYEDINISNANTEITRTKGFNSDLDRWYGNSAFMAGCESDEGWTNNGWTGAVGTYTADTYNYKWGLAGAKATIAVANGGISLVKNLDLEKFSDNSTSDTGDFVNFIVYIDFSGSLTNLPAGGITIWLPCDVRPTLTHYYNASIAKASLVAGWNCISIKKSDFSSGGSPSWSTIKGIAFAVNGTPGGTVNVTFDCVQLVRKDPTTTSKPNFFQHKEANGYILDCSTNNTVTSGINSGAYFMIGNEFGKMTCRDLATSTGNRLVGNIPFSDCVVSGVSIVKTASYCGCGTWYINNPNYVGIFIQTGNIYFRKKVNGTYTDVTVALSVAVGDIINWRIIKNGNKFYLEIVKNNDFTNVYSYIHEQSFSGLYYGTATAGVGYPISSCFGYISAFAASGDSYNIESLSITASNESTNNLTQSIALNKTNAEYQSMRRQAIMNSNFDIWQRASTFTNPTSDTFLADRWKVNYAADGGTFPNIIISKQVLTPTDIDGSYSYLRVNVDGAGSGYGNAVRYRIYQKILNGTKFLAGSGNYVTISFYARSSIANKKISIGVNQNYGTGGSPSSQETINGKTWILTSSWIRYSVTLKLNSLSGKTFGSNDNDFIAIFFTCAHGSDYNVQLGDNAAETFVGAGNIDIAQIQVNSGNMALPYEPKSIIDELRDCQRFYQPLDAAYATRMAEYSANTMYFTIPFATAMRAAPTLTWVTTPVEVTDWRIYSIVGAAQSSFGNPWISSSSRNGIEIGFTKVAHGLTDGFLYIFTSVICVDAEF